MASFLLPTADIWAIPTCTCLRMVPLAALPLTGGVVAGCRGGAITFKKKSPGLEATLDLNVQGNH